MKLTSGHKEKQLGNLQKELLTNYFLQKYTSLMSEMTNNSPADYQSNFQSRPRSPSKKINFKNLLQLRNGSNHKNRAIIAEGLYSGSNSRNIAEQISLHNSRKEGDKTENKMKRLQESFLNQLFSHSPTKLEKKQYNKLEILSERQFGQGRPNDQETENEQSNIHLTYEEMENIREQADHMPIQQEDRESSPIREAIKRQFQLRKEKPVYLKSRHSSARKRQESEAQSSKISLQGKADSTEKKEKISPLKKHSPSQYYHLKHSNASQDPSSRIENETVANLPKELTSSPQVHFAKQMVEPIAALQSPKPFSQGEDEVIEKEIEFVAPSSTYYKSQNSNFVEQAFRIQTGSYDGVSGTSERESGDKNQISHSHDRTSKKSFREKERNSSNSSGKDSSKLQTSFVSKVSLLSAAEGAYIKATIQKELFQNELGPYQSALYGVLQLIQRYPKSGTVYAVGQKTLEDRRQIDQRKKSQLQEIEDYRRKIQRLQRRRLASHLRGEEDIIKSNRLKIMQLIRQLGTKLAQ